LFIKAIKAYHYQPESQTKTHEDACIKALNQQLTVAKKRSTPHHTIGIFYYAQAFRVW
jgi:hypothetical protein